MDQPHQRPPSPQEAARGTSAARHGGLDTAQRLQRLLANCPELDRAHTLVRAFAAMFDTSDPAQLPGWLHELEASRLPGLPGLAKVFREDLSSPEPLKCRDEYGCSCIR